MQIMDGPAAVIPLFFEKGTFLAVVCHCSNLSGMGRQLKRRESQKTCLSRRRDFLKVFVSGFFETFEFCHFEEC